MTAAPRILGVALLLAAVGASGAPLLLEEVLQSTVEHHPMLLAQISQRSMAEGKALGAQGAFDTKLTADSATNSFGYYKTRTAGGGVSQPLRGVGGELFGKYERGLGNFEPWNQGLLTLSKGEWSGGIEIPLLRNRTIDRHRTELALARLGVDLADASIVEQRLVLLEMAASKYWEWVSAGRKLSIAQDLLALAEDRTQQVQDLVDAGQVAEIEIAENERAVLQRRSATASAERDLQAARLDLSLYLRGPDGRIVQVDRSRLPDFPEPARVGPEQVESDLLGAMQRRPEIAGLMVELQQNGTVMQQARNELRPELAFTAQFGRDSGTGSITKRGSELIAGITLTSPFQRRKARGEVAIQAAKLEQLMHKLQYVRDKVVVEVRDAVSALELSLRRLELARAEYDVARRLATAEMERFELGDSTLFIVNQREMVAAYAQFVAVAALTDCHVATAAYRAATASL